MHLNISTDYAIRIILYLAKSKQIVPSSRLSKVIRVSPRYLLQIGAKLRDSGFVATVPGPSGGYSLTKPASQISLYDIIVIMEGEIESRQRPEPAMKDTQEFMNLNYAYGHLQDMVELSLKSITIEELLSESLSVDTGYHVPVSSSFSCADYAITSRSDRNIQT